MPENDFDLVVIGAGPAGEKGGATAASFGKRVALVEKCADLGGAAANTGTLPSKTLRETALALSGLRARNLYGVDLSLRREATVADFMFHERHVTAHERSRIAHNVHRCGIELFRGTASFTDPRTIRVLHDCAPSDQAGSAPAETLLHADKVLIATGSAPYRPPEFAFDDPRIHDSDEILCLERLPETLLVVGAGVIGSEYASTFAALGCQVHLLDGKDVLLPFLDGDVSRALVKAMQRLGITFHWNERVTACTPTADGGISLALTSGETLRGDQVLVAAGRSSNTAELNLAAAGIEPGKRGLLTVDANFRTSAEHVYAAGDVIGFPALASTSMEQARVAMCHAFGKGYKTEISPILPYGIYTIPETSMVGETEETLAKKSVDYVVGFAAYAQNARGEIIGDSTGFLKLLFRRADLKLLGVHVLGEQASELIHIGLMVLLQGGGAEQFNAACFNYPTLGDLYKVATYDAMLKTVTAT